MNEAFAIRQPPSVRSFGLPRADALKDCGISEGNRGLVLCRQNRVWVGIEPSTKVLELARRPHPGTALFAVIARGGVSEDGRPGPRVSHERGNAGGGGVMTSWNPTISLRIAGDPATRLTILDRDEMWATAEQERLALPVPVLGFWVVLRSLPQSVEMREDALCSRLRITRHTLHKLAQALEDHGRLDRESERDDRGQFALSVWTMHVEPLPLDLRSRRVRKRTAVAIHAPDSPCTEKSYMEEKSSVVVDKIKSNTTTTAAAAAAAATAAIAGATVAADLIMPEPGLFDEAQQGTFRHMMARSSRPAVEQQQLLDELVYATRTGGVRKPAAYLARLIERANVDQYIPDGALIVARERREAGAAEMAKAAAEWEAAERLARHADPASQERVRAAAAAAITSIGGLFALRSCESEEPKEPKELDLDNSGIPHA